MKEGEWKRNYNTTDLIRQIGSPIVSAKWDILQVRNFFKLLSYRVVCSIRTVIYRTYPNVLIINVLSTL